MRLIDADELLETLKENNAPYRADINRAIIYAPTIDPVRHGDWILLPHDVEGCAYFMCSECGKMEIISTKENKPTWRYCPCCGAKMDGGKDEESEE